MTENDGLWLFVAVVLLNVIGLSVDYCLSQSGLITVTDFARRNKWAGGLILGFNASGTMGLFFHLLGKNGGK